MKTLLNVRNAPCGLWLIGAISASAMATSNPAVAQTPDWAADQEICRQLVPRAGSGLFILYPQNATLENGANNGMIGNQRYLRVNDGTVPYDRNARFYYVPNNGGVIVPKGTEAVWSVRTETVEQKQLNGQSRVAANHVMLWRPGIATSCTARKSNKNPPPPLTQFGPSERFVRLLTYAQNHPILWDNKDPRSGTLQAGLHFEVSSDCIPTNDEQISGSNRWETYGFEKIPDDSNLIRTLSYDRRVPNLRNDRVQQSVARGEEQRGAYTKEFTIVSGLNGQVRACFGFSVPIPTELHVFGLFGPSDWKPHLTEIRMRRVDDDRGARQSATKTKVRWSERTK